MALDITEEQIHLTVMDWVRLNPSLEPYVFHVANQGKRAVQYTAKLKRMGLKPGVSDLFIAIPSKGYHGAWMELKSAKGVLSPAQKQFMKDMGDKGYKTYCCKSIEDAINCIKDYCLLP